MAIDVHSVREVAQALRVEPRTVRLWIQKGQLNATRIGRDWLIDSEDFERLRTQNDWVTRLVESAPPLTEVQIQKLRDLLPPVTAEGERAA